MFKIEVAADDEVMEVGDQAPAKTGVINIGYRRSVIS